MRYAMVIWMMPDELKLPDSRSSIIGDLGNDKLSNPGVIGQICQSQYILVAVIGR